MDAERAGNRLHEGRSVHWGMATMAMAMAMVLYRRGTPDRLSRYVPGGLTAVAALTHPGNAPQ